MTAAVGKYDDWRFSFDTTDTSNEYLVSQTKQDDCPMFHQAMCVLYGDNYKIELLSDKRIIVIDNPKSVVKDAHIISVEDDGTDEPVREYRRVEKTADVEVLEFDGEGIVSKELANVIDPSSAHHFFQIRMPYIKGVVH